MSESTSAIETATAATRQEANVSAKDTKKEAAITTPTATPSMAKASKSSRQSRATIKIPKGTRDTEPYQMMIRDKVFSQIKNVFLKHGAVGIDTPVFELKETLTGKYGEDSKLIYDLADQGGEICALRYDLTVPFARYLAEHAIDNIKRYHIARVYRRDNPAFTRGRYREFYQCDYDVAGKYAAMVPDSECIKVCSEILDGIPQIGPYVIKLNHRKLIDAIMLVCGVPENKMRAICSAIDKLDKEAWNDVKKEMVTVKGLDETSADQIGSYVTQFKGEPLTVLASLRQNETLAAHPLAQEAFTDLSTLFSYLTALQCIHRVSFDLSLARGLDYYTGVIYEAVLTSESQVGSIAAGGRYDGLVGKFSAKDIPAVGISVGIERIFGIIEQQEQAKMKAGAVVRRNATQVVVASVGNGLLTKRMSSCAALWAAGINTEFVYDENPKPKKQMDLALDVGASVVVWHGEEEEKEGMVKVKNLLNREEVKVKAEDMVQTVKKILSDSASATSVASNGTT